MEPDILEQFGTDVLREFGYSGHRALRQAAEMNGELLGQIMERMTSRAQEYGGGCFGPADGVASRVLDKIEFAVEQLGAAVDCKVQGAAVDCKVLPLPLIGGPSSSSQKEQDEQAAAEDEQMTQVGSQVAKRRRLQQSNQKEQAAARAKGSPPATADAEDVFEGDGVAAGSHRSLDEMIKNLRSMQMQYRGSDGKRRGFELPKGGPENAAFVDFLNVRAPHFNNKDEHIENADEPDEELMERIKPHRLWFFKAGTIEVAATVFDDIAEFWNYRNRKPQVNHI